MTGDDEFFRTRMGRQFYEVTMPKIANELGRLNATMAELLTELRAFRAVKPPSPSSAPVDA